MGVISSYKANGFKYFTPKRMWMFIRSLYYKVFGYKIKPKHAQALSEVLVYKASKCTKCIKDGECEICKCPTKDLFLSMDAPCSQGRFPAFDSYGEGHWSENWEQYKKDEGVYIQILNI